MPEPVFVPSGAELKSTKLGDFTVQSTCESDDGNAWCITHDEGFRNNMSRDDHIRNSKQSCQIGWFCPDHGMEEM
jgi:hypothetical protein